MDATTEFAPETRGLANPAVIDLFTQDAASGVVMLVMVAHKPWDGGEEQLFQFQEKLNAYLSFVLDGEMTDAYPQLVGKPVKIRLDSLYPLDVSAHQMALKVHEHLSFQGIEFEVFVPPQEGEQGGCGCGHGGCAAH